MAEDEYLEDGGSLYELDSFDLEADSGCLADEESLRESESFDLEADSDSHPIFLGALPEVEYLDDEEGLYVSDSLGLESGCLGLESGSLDLESTFLDLGSNSLDLETGSLNLETGSASDVDFFKALPGVAYLEFAGSLYELDWFDLETGSESDETFFRAIPDDERGLEDEGFLCETNSSGLETGCAPDVGPFIGFSVVEMAEVGFLMIVFADRSGDREQSFNSLNLEPDSGLSVNFSRGLLRGMDIADGGCLDKEVFETRSGEGRE